MIVVVGAGVAGLTAVDQLAEAGVAVTLVTAGCFGADGIAAGNTALAQGGIAAALGPDDTPQLHAADTITAGAGLVDADVAGLLAQDGATLVQKLIDAGFPADRNANGQLVLGLEAAHSAARIVHAGEDSSGAALSAFLTARGQRHIASGAVRLIQQATLTQLVTATGRVTGLRYQTVTGTHLLDADAAMFATGGYAGLYATTSSSAAVDGRGILVAATAGAVLADMEFVQFHPTVLPATGELISEAVRGAGAVLRDPVGQRFMVDVHPDAELAPRDVVSRASVATMEACDTQTVWLDATVIEQLHGRGTLSTRFPVLTQRLAAHGIDWTTEWVPVAPAAHYCMGGVATDTSGRTSIAGLYAAGEAASTGVHGANRLASNSLLEGLVFGARAAQSALKYLADGNWAQEPQFRKFIASSECVSHTVQASAPTHDRHHLQSLTQRYLGITRSRVGLETLLSALEGSAHPLAPLVRIMGTAALARTESRGGHWRADYPLPDPSRAMRTAWQLNTTPYSSVGGQAAKTKEQLQHVDV